MKMFVIGFVVAIVAIVAAGTVYVELGDAPVATAAPPLPLEKWITHTALRKKVGKEAPTTVPITASEETYEAGAKIYRQNCAVCHGLPGQKSGAIAQGEFPPPPDLLGSMGVTDDPPGVTYWKVANGIRLSGMPSFKQSLTNEQIWQVTLLVENADKLPPAVEESLKKPLPQD